MVSVFCARLFDYQCYELSKNLRKPLVFIQLCGVINYQKQCDFQIVSLILFGYRFFVNSIDKVENGGQIPP